MRCPTWVFRRCNRHRLGTSHRPLRRLDVIIAVDEVDTANLTAADVTLLVAKRMGNKTRKIRFLRGKASEYIKICPFELVDSFIAL